MLLTDTLNPATLIVAIVTLLTFKSKSVLVTVFRLTAPPLVYLFEINT